MEELMDTSHIDELRNIDLWVKTGAIDYDRAKKMARPHVEAVNEKAAEIAERLGVRAKKVYFHSFVR
jgi:predicted nucleotidyltransferase